MIQWILDTLVGDYNTKQLQSIQKIIPLIHDRYDRFDDLSDDEIKAKTPEFKQRINNGELLDMLLPEVFATVKQACKRMVGMKIKVKDKEMKWDMVPYDVQFVGGIILHQ